MTFADAIKLVPALCIAGSCRDARRASMSFICAAVQKTGVAGSPAVRLGTWATTTNEQRIPAIPIAVKSWLNLTCASLVTPQREGITQSQGCSSLGVES